MPNAPFIGMEHVEPHSNQVLETVPASTMASNAARFYEGDVLYGRMRPYLNKVVSPSFDGLASAEFIVFPKNEVINSRFLLRRLSSNDFTQFACSQYEGDRPRVKFDQLGNFEVLVPPAAEQARIVEKLEELLSDLDAGVAELKAAQRKLVQYRQSLLKAAVEGALTADWRAAHGELQESGAELLQRILAERRARWEQKQLVKFAEQGKMPPIGWQSKYSQPVAPDVADLTPLPEGWAWASLQQLAEFVTSGSRGWADYYADCGATFIRSQNINRDWLDLSDIAYVNPPSNSEGARTRVQRGDVLLTITGANVGRSAVVNIDMNEAYVSQHVALIRPVCVGLSDYLHLFLTCKAGGRGQLDRQAYGAGKPGLNLQQVQSIVVPIPNHDELPELLNVVASTLDAASAQADSIERGLLQAAAQRKNLLKAAFVGGLVEQDPNDEPASELLARIRAERASNDRGASRRRRKSA
jgi:type I restriction enzyme S subunit